MYSWSHEVYATGEEGRRLGDVDGDTGFQFLPGLITFVFISTVMFQSLKCVCISIKF